MKETVHGNRMEAWKIRYGSSGEELIVALHNGKALKFEANTFEMFWDDPTRFLALNKNKGVLVDVNFYFDCEVLYGTNRWTKLKKDLTSC